MDTVSTEAPKQTTKMAPTDEMSSERAAEVLRLTLPMMSRNGIPTTPQNYAVWYAYVTGDCPSLTTEIDRLIADGQRFTAGVNARLYRKFISEHDLEQVESVRNHLGTLIDEVGTRLVDADNDADVFVGKLDNFRDGMSHARDIDGVKDLLGKLLVETREIRESNAGMRAHFDDMNKQIAELKEQVRAERERAATDPLTGLYNRVTLLERIDDALSEATTERAPSIIMLDIDHFKMINDTHGHLIGDRVIRFVAKTLHQNIKGQDTAARFGGEEFTVLLPGTNASGAMAVAEAIRKVIEAAQLVRADTKKPIGDITISAGVATYLAGESAEELLQRSDQALYKSKNDGRNRCTSAD